MPDEELVMSFDPNTIEHLGVRMYSTLPPVLAELIANAYDADAGHVSVQLNDSGEEKEIIVEDDGLGMSFGDLNERFLRIGRNRRIEETNDVTANGRKIIGKKGLGKLSFFGIAHQVLISTKQKGKQNEFLMDWDAIKRAKRDYKPTIVKKDEPCSTEEHGTKVILSKIQRETDFSAEDIANNLARMFIVDPSFEISVRRNAEAPIAIENERRYAQIDIRFKWRIPEDSEQKSDYGRVAEISGELIAARKPIPPGTNMRGIALFSRKKLVNAPEFFSDSTSSHFFSYLTGWLEVDFIDDLEEDVITTNRQSLNWDHSEMKELRVHLRGLLNWAEKDWRKKRDEEREKELLEKTGINLPEWFSKLPKEEREKVEPLVRSIIKGSELPDEANQTAVKYVHEIVPEYPRYHWRNLHPEVQNVSKDYYIGQDYYTAFFEAAKRYVNAVKSKTGSTLTDRQLLENVFAITNPKLSVTSKFKKPSGDDFEASTLQNMTEGHRMLALGIWAACRCPVAHEEVCDLRDSGLFTEKDCLDALSLLSHLFNRLDNAETV